MSEHVESDASIIYSMPPDLVNKIAAGEVIQRPGSVVKELLDNALDAGADEIRIVIQNSGRSLIQVIDNGCGMSEADVRLCFRQHATSKIRSVEDLYKIRTLGFRGEAMASIASVSQVELKSRRHNDETGVLCELHGGEEMRFEPAAVQAGTSVAVRNLFYNVPARRQFLRTDATEFRHILRTIHNAALAQPDVSFELVADMDRIYKLPAQPLEQRVAEIFGRSYRASLIPFEEVTSYVRIRGLLGDPKISKKSRGEQFLFVNNRPVQHRYLTHLLISLYDAWQGDREYPFFAIFLEMDPRQVDVNVHPAKLEVKFDDEKSILQLTQSVVKKALNEYLLVPDIEKRESGEKQSFDTSFREFKSFMESPGRGGEVHIPSRINESGGGLDGTELGKALYQPEGESRRIKTETVAKSTGTGEIGFWQLHNTYILTQTRTGLCMIDQHAAHMRIIYEKALSATEESLPGTQQLLFAQTMELSATDYSQLKELLPIIQRMGFSIQLLSGNSVIINGVPADIDIGDERKVVREMLQQYRDLDRSVKLDARHKVAISFAARTAIPAGKHLTVQEMEMIIDQLFACEEPYLDPLKKPVLVYMPMDEIRNRFR